MTSSGQVSIKTLDPVSTSGLEVPKVWNSNCANCTLYKFHSFSAQVSETTLSYHNVMTFGSETIAGPASLSAKRDGDWHRVPFRILSFTRSQTFKNPWIWKLLRNGRKQCHPAGCLESTCGGMCCEESIFARTVHAGALAQEHKTWSWESICKAFEGREC